MRQSLSLLAALGLCLMLCGCPLDKSSDSDGLALAAAQKAQTEATPSHDATGLWQITETADDGSNETYNARLYQSGSKCSWVDTDTNLTLDFSVNGNDYSYYCFAPDNGAGYSLDINENFELTSSTTLTGSGVVVQKYTGSALKKEIRYTYTGQRISN